MKNLTLTILHPTKEASISSCSAVTVFSYLQFSMQPFFAKILKKIFKEIFNFEIITRIYQKELTSLYSPG